MKSPTIRRRYHRDSPSKSPIRDRSPRNRRQRNESASPSPPRNSKSALLKSIRITIKDINPVKKPAKFSILHTRHKDPDFKGPEDILPRTKDQRKIQIEIRRSIPSHKISVSPVRREISDPYSFSFTRRKDEG